MPLSSAEKFRRALEAVNRGDIDGALEHVAPTIEWRTPATLPDTQTYHGHEGVRKWWELMDDAFEHLRIDPTGEFAELDDVHVLVPVGASGRGRESGVPVNVSFFMMGTGLEQLERM